MYDSRTIKQDWIECGRTAVTKLTISSLKADTEYVFRVRAEMDGGAVYSAYSPISTPVRTLVDGSAPEFSKRLPGDMQVTTGSATVLTAQVGVQPAVLLLIYSCSNVQFAGKPAPTVRWTCNGNELNGKHTHVAIVSTKEKSVLTIKSSDVTMEGVYR